MLATFTEILVTKYLLICYGNQKTKNNNNNNNIKVLIVMIVIFNPEYHCGGMEGWSAIYEFKALQSGVDWSPRMAVFGDMGSVNAKSISFLQEETQQGLYDAFLHVGMYIVCLCSRFRSLNICGW